MLDASVADLVRVIAGLQADLSAALAEAREARAELAEEQAKTRAKRKKDADRKRETSAENPRNIRGKSVESLPPPDGPPASAPWTPTSHPPLKPPLNPAHVHARVEDAEIPFADGFAPIDPSLVDEPAILLGSWVPPLQRHPVPTRRRPEPAPKPRDTFPSEFEAWWARYPRKVKKDEAVKSWKRVIAAGAKPVELMAGLDRWLASADWADAEPKYKPHPTTWLNQKYWHDEPDPATPAPGTADGLGALKVIPNEVAGRPWVPSWLQHGGQSTGLASVMNFAKQMGVDPYEAEARFNDGGLPSAGDFVWANRKTG